jgi:hypothetical protein
MIFMIMSVSGGGLKYLFELQRLLSNEEETKKKE